MFSIEMLPARYGDSLWIQYGPPDRPRCMLVDGGTTGTYVALRSRLNRMQQDDGELELIVVTHIDADHIAGILKLLEEDPLPFRVLDIWFNGYRHLPDTQLEELGPVQGEKLTTRLLKPDLNWNGAFGGRAVAVPDSGPLPVFTLPGELKLTILSPGQQELRKLKPVWRKEVEEAGLDPTLPGPDEAPPSRGLERLGPPPLPDVEELATRPFSEDQTEANGSSIALMAEFGGRRILLGADAHPSVLLAALDQLAGKDNPVPVDVFKVPHHGSKFNVSQELLRRAPSRHYLISTNGARFKHPDHEAVARIVAARQEAPAILFNYQSKYNEIWGDPRLTVPYGYSAVFPKQGEDRVSIQL